MEALQLSPGPNARILVVDDELMQRRAHQRVLDASGYEVQTAENGEAALAQLRAGRFDAVISDISMPGMDGLSLLKKIREIDLDLPVILVTGEPTLERAAQAMEYGAFRFISKPAEPEAIERGVKAAVSLGRAARVRRETLGALDGAPQQSGDRAAREVCFERALDKIWMAFQPIVRWSTRSIYAYEALVRSAEPSLPHPGALLDAADDLGRMRQLGRRIRERTVPPFANAPLDARLFVNLHTSDLTDELLLSPGGPFAGITKRVTLEVTERASLHLVDSVRDRIAELRAAGYAIALDDLGAGFAGLSSLALLEPEVIKVDMSLVRDVHLSPIRRRLIESMVTLARDFGQELVAEGVETIAERDVLLDLGCDLFQGYLFARPGKPFPEATWV